MAKAKPRKRQPVDPDYIGEVLRINKILARAGLGSRKQAEEMILKGRVSLDGEIVEDLGAKADPATQEVALDGQPVRFTKKTYLAFYKPEGFDTIRLKNPNDAKKTIWPMLPDDDTLIAVASLDNRTEGLMIVTNDGDFAQRVSLPKNHIEKSYVIVAKGKLEAESIRQLKTGVWISDGMMSIAEVKVKKCTKDSSVVELFGTARPTEQIREVFVKLGHPVSRLTRIAIGPVTIAGIEQGSFRELTREELLFFSGYDTAPRKTKKKNKPRKTTTIHSPRSGKPGTARKESTGTKGRRQGTGKGKTQDSWKDSAKSSKAGKGKGQGSWKDSEKPSKPGKAGKNAKNAGSETRGPRPSQKKTDVSRPGKDSAKKGTKPPSATKPSIKPKPKPGRKPRGSDSEFVG